jgi:hypothetical protein
MAKRKIFINGSGDVVALCDNIIENASDLGTRTIHRVADVEFNNKTDEWEIIDCKTGEILGSDKERSKAIDKEIDLMNARLENVLRSNPRREDNPRCVPSGCN